VAELVERAGKYDEREHEFGDTNPVVREIVSEQAGEQKPKQDKERRTDQAFEEETPGDSAEARLPVERGFFQVAVGKCRDRRSKRRRHCGRGSHALRSGENFSDDGNEIVA
jgi:hypothetical protein